MADKNGDRIWVGGNAKKGRKERVRKEQEPLTNYATSSQLHKPAHATSMRHGCQLVSWHRADWPPQQQPVTLLWVLSFLFFIAIRLFLLRLLLWLSATPASFLFPLPGHPLITPTGIFATRRLFVVSSSTDDAHRRYPRGLFEPHV